MTDNMETCGIIAEYNPFHNGHAYQAARVRARLGPNTGIIAVMSGDFVQRGGPAVCDKWTRALWAVEGGIDLVLELPVRHATASAERFGDGGVRLLQAAGIVRHIAFGAETSDLDALTSIAGLLADELAQFKKHLAEKLSDGSGFAAARQQAVGAMLGAKTAALLRESNAILAVSYLVAMKRIRAGFKPLLIERKGPGEHGQAEGTFAPASHIRSVLLDAFAAREPHRALPLLACLPAGVLAGLFEAAFQARLGSFERLFPHALAALIAHDEPSLLAFPSLQPDLAMRLKNQAGDRSDPADAAGFVDRAATRAYPAARVRRALTDLYLGDLLTDAPDAPQVIHVLAFSRRGRYLLRLLKHHAALPVVTRSSDVFEMTGGPRLELEQSLRAADLYQLLVKGRTRADFDRTVGIL